MRSSDRSIADEPSTSAAGPLTMPDGLGRHCGECGYDLCGLRTPNCPECGANLRGGGVRSVRPNRDPWRTAVKRLIGIAAYLAVAIAIGYGVWHYTQDWIVNEIRVSITGIAAVRIDDDRVLIGHYRADEHHTCMPGETPPLLEPDEFQFDFAVVEMPVTYDDAEKRHESTSLPIATAETELAKHELTRSALRFKENGPGELVGDLQSAGVEDVDGVLAKLAAGADYIRVRRGVLAPACQLNAARPEAISAAHPIPINLSGVATHSTKPGFEDQARSVVVYKEPTTMAVHLLTIGFGELVAFAVFLCLWPGRRSI